MSKKCVLYLRVSTDLQDYQRQKDDLTSFAKANSYTYGKDDIYEDKLSGFKGREERKGLDKLLKDVVEQQIQVVLVWEISRLSRNQTELLKIKDIFIKNSVNVYFYQQSFWLLDSRTNKVNPNAELLISFFGWNSEYEARLTKERFHSAKKRYVREGKYNGGQITFGYTIGRFGKTNNESDKKFIVNEEKIEGLNVSEADIVREVFELYENGDTCSKIARYCKSKGYPKHVCSPHTIARLLRNTSYIGFKDVKLGKRPVPPIIERTQFVRVGELLDSNKTKADKGRKHTYLLRGLLKCRICGRYYLGKQTDDAYQCALNNATNKFIHNTPCNGGNISISNIDGIIWERVKDIWIHKKLYGFDTIFEQSDQEIEKYKKGVVDYENLLTEIDRKRKKTNRIYQNDGFTNDEYDLEIGNINKEINQINLRIQELKLKIRRNEKQRKNADKVINRRKDIDLVKDRKEMKSIIKSLVRDIVFTKVNLFKTIVFIKYEDGSNETILFNSVAKKGNKFKLINSKFVSFNEEDRFFYLLKKEYHVLKNAKDIVEFAKMKLSTNHFETPNKDNSDKYDFDSLMTLKDIPQIISTHSYEKLTYFKDLNLKRFNNKNKI